MIVEDELEKLFAKRSDHITPGLARMNLALSNLDWHKRIPPTFLIGGTNGKGTTASCLWILLSALFEKVGLYTSPHIKNFHERIQLSHKTLNDGQLVGELGFISKLLDVDLYQQLSFFELTTLLALHIFLQEEVSCQVLEVGLGGRLDATNAIDPIISCVTSVDFDHMQWLGNTLGSIANEKLGIARPKKPLFWLEDLALTEQKGLLAKLSEVENQGVDLFCQERDFLVLDNRIKLMLPSTPLLELEVPNHLERGKYFKQNLAGACAMFWWMLHHDKLGFQFENKLDAFYQGWSKLRSLEKVKLPNSMLARGQTATVKCHDSEPFLYLDVAHNPAAIKHLVNKLSEQNKKPSAIACSFLGDKDYHSMLASFADWQVPVYSFVLPSARSLSFEDLMKLTGDRTFADFSSLWQELHSLNFSAQAPLLICGSFVAVGECMKYLRLKNERGWDLVGKCPICSVGTSFSTPLRI